MAKYTDTAADSTSVTFKADTWSDTADAAGVKYTMGVDPAIDSSDPSVFKIHMTKCPSCKENFHADWNSRTHRGLVVVLCDDCYDNIDVSEVLFHFEKDHADEYKKETKNWKKSNPEKPLPRLPYQVEAERLSLLKEIVDKRVGLDNIRVAAGRALLDHFHFHWTDDWSNPVDGQELFHQHLRDINNNENALINKRFEHYVDCTVKGNAAITRSLYRPWVEGNPSPELAQNYVLGLSYKIGKFTLHINTIDFTIDSLSELLWHPDRYETQFLDPVNEEQRDWDELTKLLAPIGAGFWKSSLEKIVRFNGKTWEEIKEPELTTVASGVKTHTHAPKTTLRDGDLAVENVFGGMVPTLSGAPIEVTVNGIVVSVGLGKGDGDCYFEDPTGVAKVVYTGSENLHWNGSVVGYELDLGDSVKVSYSDLSGLKGSVGGTSYSMIKPLSPDAGDIYYDSTEEKMMIFNGDDWAEVAPAEPGIVWKT